MGYALAAICLELHADLADATMALSSEGSAVAPKWSSTRGLRGDRNEDIPTHRMVDGRWDDAPYSISKLSYGEQGNRNPTAPATDGERVSYRKLDFEEEQQIMSDPPSTIPTQVPTMSPSGMPSDFPSLVPSVGPSPGPSDTPSSTPTVPPSARLSASPSTSPSFNPIAPPSSIPTVSPSASPSFNPSAVPSARRSPFPTLSPKNTPSSLPSDFPSLVPNQVIPLSDFPSRTSTTMPVTPTIPPHLPSDVPTFSAGFQENSARYNKQFCSSDESNQEDMSTMIMDYSYSLVVEDGYEYSAVIGAIEDYLNQALRDYFCAFGNVERSRRHLGNDEVAFSASPVDLISDQACNTQGVSDCVVDGGLTIWLKRDREAFQSPAVVLCEVADNIQFLVKLGALNTIPGVKSARIESITSCNNTGGSAGFSLPLSYVVAASGAFVVLALGGFFLRSLSLESPYSSSLPKVQNVPEDFLFDITITEDTTVASSRDHSLVTRSESMNSGEQNSLGMARSSSVNSCSRNSLTMPRSGSLNTSSRSFSPMSATYREGYRCGVHQCPSSDSSNSEFAHVNADEYYSYDESDTNDTIVLDSKLLSLSMTTIHESVAIGRSLSEEDVWETIPFDEEIEIDHESCQQI